MKIENFIDKSYIENGVSLKKLGINEVAFKKEDALKILGRLEKQNIAVLGGDVYVVKDNIITPTYDNWFINRNNEKWSLYVKKSIKKARLYINEYSYAKKNIFFSLVISTQ